MASKEISSVKETVSKEKYYLEGENYEDMCHRVSMFIAAAEKPHFRNKYYLDFFSIMKDKKFIPGGRILANAGTFFENLDSSQREFLSDRIKNYPPDEIRCGQMLNCYVIPIEDSKHGPGGIYQSIEDAADITAMEGGVGENFSNLRPENSPIRGNKKYKSSGPVSFLRVFDKSSKELRQGGGRRGANMAVMDCDHPDIFKFVDCKRVEGDIDNYNISVGIYDSFMKAVESDGFWDLKWGGTVYRTIKARELFDKICENIWKDGGGGEPGIIFFDADKKWPFKNNQKITTNPCIVDDSWIMTTAGPKQVKDLISKPFKSKLHGVTYLSKEGFWKTGEKIVYRMDTIEGYSIECTGDHEVYLYDEIEENKKIPVSQLKEGDLIQLDRNTVRNSWKGPGGSLDEGYILGFLIGDGTFSVRNNPNGGRKEIAVISVWYSENEKDVTEGTRHVMRFIEDTLKDMPHRSDWGGWKKISRNDGDFSNEYRIGNAALTELAHHYGIHPVDKKIGPEIEKASSDFQRGFLSGFFDSDGCVTKTGNTTVRLSQNNVDRLYAVQRMLHRFGIFSTIYEKHRNVENFSKVSDNPEYDLVISKEDIIRFSDIIGFVNTDKQNKLDNAISEFSRGPYRRNPCARFKSLTELGKKDVYDVTIEEKHRFNANGIIISNCGEQKLGYYEACDLGAINLYSFVKHNPDNDTWYFDFEDFADTIYTAIRFLDNVLDVNNYPLKYRDDICRKISMDNRRIGLGIMGLADTLMAMGYGYGSDDSIKFIEEVMGVFNTEAVQASFELGTEKGPFLKHEEALEIYRGRRNCCVTTIAPTGTTSMIAGVWGGCEPFFGLVTRKKTTDGSGIVYYMVPGSFKNLCDRNGIDLTDSRLEEIYNNRGSVQGLSWFPKTLQDKCKTTMDIGPLEHVRVQCTLQKYIENSISKTVNLNRDSTLKDVSDCIFALWRGGAKGGTIYRDGTRNLQIMNVGGSEKKESENNKLSAPTNRPEVLSGKTHKVVASLNNDLENIYVTVNELESAPYEIFIHSVPDLAVVKFEDFLISNGVRFDVAQMVSSKMLQLSRENICVTTRLVSLCLKNNIKISDIIKQLRKINQSDVHNIHKKIAKILSGYYKEDIVLDRCSNVVDGKRCGGQIVYQQGCMSCPECGLSKCD